VGLIAVPVAAGLAVGGLLALFLAGLGLFVSTLAGSNRLSLSISLLVLLADPMSAGLHYLGKLVVDGHSAGQDIWWLVGPAIAAALAVTAALGASRFITLRGGGPA
jgi:ABC-2 type transport system permease protein